MSACVTLVSLDCAYNTSSGRCVAYLLYCCNYATRYNNITIIVYSDTEIIYYLDNIDVSARQIIIIGHQIIIICAPSGVAPVCPQACAVALPPPPYRLNTGLVIRGGVSAIPPAVLGYRVTVILRGLFQRLARYALAAAASACCVQIALYYYY